ncbi:hypothetical protein Z517_07930 [Fonsecaea pedrosoi CBS 271.37]|uniref:Annexin n=1 Tax=Fonsecaea pedrosoi CBS 271.37 TaxID=1442368 RepID=A0A0D2EV42_9EURO|nr:uncharacterized protein Z517_07930 [Fonsecaea pedrosoi CBS 271.37]KIW78097.1 hypothetical protein Z517_07930 [Fonsecaea pedrosoi CBS 271.37]
MSSMLDVRDDRRSRSKSPSGRDRDRSRSRSRDARDRDSPDEYSSRRSSRKYAEPQDDQEQDRGYKDRRSSKKYYDEEEEEQDRRNRRRSSKKYADEDDEEDKYRSYRSSKDPRVQEIAPSDDDRNYERRKKSDSDSDRRRERRGKSGRGKGDDSAEESDSDARRRYKDRDPGYPNGNGTYPYPPGAYGEMRPEAVRHMSYTANDPRYATPGAYNGGGSAPAPQRASSYGGANGPQYANLEQYKYADPSEIAPRRPEYERSRPSDYERSRTKDTRENGNDYRSSKYETRTPTDKKYDDDRFETREPKRKDRRDEYDNYARSDRRRDKDRYGSSPEEVTKRMPTLAVGGAALGAATLGVAHHNSHDGNKPPPSPLLEAYKGTYQSISPMPSALVLANHKGDSDLSDFELDLDDRDADADAELKRKIRQLEREKEKYTKGHNRGASLAETTHEVRPRRLSKLDTNLDVEVREPGSANRDRSPSRSIMSPGGGSGRRKTVSFYDPSEDAKRIAAALAGTRSAPDPRPLVQILPRLSTDDLLALRAEYKNHAKVSGQGINMAKHIKMRIPGNLGKACYATALGRWESEAYWANSWYQGGASRRELLIESLMGRSNSDIREIKNCFKDKKYSDDLEKCIRTELKADKFRVAILLALEERRMPESTPLDIRLIKEDVVQLAEALESKGGETDMIKIIVLRSDAHLREVLRLFERTYGVNFARQMISKSRNLVGETLAHILNGALNRPMRDALLLHQAINETAPGKERTELLISRLVRMHWEPKHLERVKAVYRERYRCSVEEDVKREVWGQMKTVEGRFCAEFCIELIRSSSI